MPDVSTSEKLKAALVAARSVAYTNPAEGGTSGIYFTKVANDFGIGDAVAKKAVLTKGGREAAIEVVEGRAEMAIVFVSEAIAVKGVKVAGLLPPTLQDYSAYATAIPAEQHRCRRRARLHCGADLGRHGRTLALQRVRAAEVTTAGTREEYPCIIEACSAHSP